MTNDLETLGHQTGCRTGDGGNQCPNNVLLSSLRPVILRFSTERKSIGDNTYLEASQEMLVVKKLPAGAGDIRDMSLITGLKRFPGGGDSNPFHYSCWKIPRTEKPGGLQSMGLHRVRNA